MIIEEPKKFALEADRLIQSIDVVYVDELDTTAVEALSRESAQKVDGTLKVHKVVRCREEL